MSMKVYPTSENTGQIEVGGVARLLFAENGDLRGSTTPAVDADGKTLVTLDMLRLYGGMPRFTPYVWGGRGDAMPEGDTQSSGQQLLDLMYPDMRADVVATQFTCTEAEWQADPYKRVTHWSLGDGVSWMRPPDKNGVQPGNVGAFYGAGSNPAGAKTGTAVIDAMRNLKGSAGVHPTGSATPPISGAFTWSLNPAGMYRLTPSEIISTPYNTLSFDASAALPAGTTTDSVTGEFRPRTWYGIWMIRMYGRVVNPGALDAPALNARLDMMDARVATLEGRQKALGDGQVRQDVTSQVTPGVVLTNTFGRAIKIVVSVTTTATSGFVNLSVLVGGVWVNVASSQAATPSAGLIISADIFADENYRVAVGSAAISRVERVS